MSSNSNYLLNNQTEKARKDLDIAISSYACQSIQNYSTKPVISGKPYPFDLTQMKVLFSFFLLCHKILNFVAEVDQN